MFELVVCVWVEYYFSALGPRVQGISVSVFFFPYRVIFLGSLFFPFFRCLRCYTLLAIPSTP